MSKRTVFTTITPLPAGISRQTVMETLHDHLEMIDLNPLVEERHPIKPPPNSTAEEYHCQWYALTDKVQYLPGGLASGKVTYNCCFHDLTNGLQTHCYAPMGLNIKGKWTLCGSLPGEPVAPVELGVGAPLSGLYVREDVDMKCNIMMTGFVKKTLRKAHASLVDRILVKAQIVDAALENQRINDKVLSGSVPPSLSSRNSIGHSQNNGYEDSIIEETSSSAPQIPYTPGQPSPPISQHPMFRTSTNSSEIRDKTAYDNSLYPKALSTRSQSPSFSSSSASVSGSQKNGRGSYGDMSQTQNAGARVSWNQLNSARHSGMSNGGEQSGNPYRVSAMSYHAELPAPPQQHQQQFQGQNSRYEAPLPPLPPPQYQQTPGQYHAELE
ncbi:hypothetical protein B0J14DRAFT_654375 [Halenospora varia]|nr:hypothetical protein B0J14DRAFT_654375 [Halenospora varia]